MSPEIPPYDEAPETPEAGHAAAVSEAPELLLPPRPAAVPPSSGAAGGAGSGTAPKPLGRVEPLNLAGRPFLNSRPVVRVSLLLLALGIVLLIGNVSRFLNYREASADKRAQIARGDVEIQKAEAAQAQLQKKLDNFNLEQQNLKIDFLNRQIGNRTFSWSTLLDRIAERLPHGVRLNRLAPLTGEKAERELQRSRTSSRRGTRAADQVTLAITGEDRDDEALMTFVDAFYKPPFSYPDLVREEPAENKAENGKPEDSKLKKFELTVQYHPGASGIKPAAGAASAVPRLEELPPPAPTAPKTTLHATPAPPAGVPGAPRKGVRP